MTVVARSGSISIIQSARSCPVDRLATWLADRSIDVVHAYRGAPVPARAGSGLIVLGGQISPYDDVRAPWLPAVRELIEDCVSRGVPTLGICLGAQLLAVVRGGHVDLKPPSGGEIGVVDVRLRPEAEADGLFGGVRSPFPATTKHVDVISKLPDDAVWLAESATCPYQAFRVGATAWGVQFHPELSPWTFTSWTDGMPDENAKDAAREVEKRDTGIARHGRALVHRFASLCQ